MKKNIIFFRVAIIALLFASCKKDNPTITTPTPSHANTPTCAYTSIGLVGGNIIHYITFFDLSSSKTSDKKYFTVELKFVGVKDSFEVVVPTQSINNLAAGFPAEIIDHPGSGLVNQWTNPLYTLRTNGGSSYIKDTIVRNPQSNYYDLYLNYLSGPLKGKFPNSNFDGFRVPTGSNAQTNLHYRTLFYFSEELCYDANDYESPKRIKSISSLYRGAPNYDWKNVSSGLQLLNGSGSTFYFLDFKNWRYFRWEQHMTNVLGLAQLATTFESYQSLDNLIKWPEGWGKK
jgi:hypothetical protein